MFLAMDSDYITSYFNLVTTYGLFRSSFMSDAVETSIGMAGAIRPKLGVVSGILDTISFLKWSAPYINDTTYIFDYSCSGMDCQISGIRNP